MKRIYFFAAALILFAAYATTAKALKPAPAPKREACGGNVQAALELQRAMNACIGSWK